MPKMAEVLAAFKKLLRRPERDAASKPIEIWFQDEARVGQKNKIIRRWTRRGTRPYAPHAEIVTEAPARAGSTAMARPMP
jgi:hypothetical protein